MKSKNTNIKEDSVQEDKLLKYAIEEFRSLRSDNKEDLNDIRRKIDNLAHEITTLKTSAKIYTGLIGGFFGALTSIIITVVKNSIKGS